MGVEFKQGDPWNPSESPVTIRRKNGAVSSFDELPLYHALVYGTTSRGVELWLEHPDGTKVPVLVNAAPVFDNAGRVTSAIAVFEDVTALQEVEQMKSDFLSMISHDLRGPLSTIKGLSSSLLMTNATADVDTLLEYISNIDEEADRMTELVSNLLDMSRIEARSMPLDYEVCHIADIARDCVSRVRRARDSELHPIVLDVPPDLPEMYCDYDQIGRVVSNLLSNAMKYSGDGTSITLRAYTGAQGQEVVVEVSDEGVGIPESELDRIFDKFYRVSSNIGRQKPGSGLGLAICKSIVDAHGGRIAVESQPQQGSTFRFSIPVEPDALK
jgi:signal transduction histidine kinase